MGGAEDLIRPEFIEAINTFLREYKLVIGGFLGLATLTAMLTLIINLTGFGYANVGFGAGQKEIDKTRVVHMKGVLVSGVCLSVLGSLSVWYMLFINGIIGGAN